MCMRRPRAYAVALERKESGLLEMASSASARATRPSALPGVTDVLMKAEADQPIERNLGQL